MDERRIAIGNDKVGKLAGPKKVQFRGNLASCAGRCVNNSANNRFSFRLPGFLDDSQRAWPQFVFFVARKLIACAAAKRHVPVGSRSGEKRSVPTENKLRQCPIAPLQFDIGVHVGG